MIKKLVLIGILAVATAVFAFDEPAHAHFTIEDTNTGVGAIFHVTPDHDPIAGKESIISYDFSETELQASDYSYELTVKSTKDEAVDVPFEVSGNVILAEYIFPAQGFYDIELTATHKDDGEVSQLHYGQRVSRGEVTRRDQSFGTLEIVAIAAVALISVSAIIFSIINDRKNRKEKGNEKGNRT